MADDDEEGVGMAFDNPRIGSNIEPQQEAVELLAEADAVQAYVDRKFRVADVMVG